MGATDESLMADLLEDGGADPESDETAVELEVSGHAGIRIEWALPVSASSMA
jgi:hypothetical protein